MPYKLLLPIYCVLFFSLPLWVEADTYELTVELEGQGRFVLTNPHGDRVGSQNITIYEEVPDSTLFLDDDGQSVSITDATVGTYTLETSGHSYDRDAQLVFQYEHTDGTFEYFEHSIFTRTSSSNTWDFVFDPNLTETFIDSPYFGAPGLGHQNTDNTVELVWETIEQAASYTVYRKEWFFPFYEEIATTQNTHYQTNDEWGEVVDQQTTIPSNWYTYRVSWSDVDGNESVLSLSVANNDRDNDGIDDYRETYVYDTNPDLVDTDSDGIDDFLEINRYGTNPRDSDTDDDAYSDGTEVEHNSDPLDRASVPVDEDAHKEEAEENQDDVIVEIIDVPAGYVPIVVQIIRPQESD